MLKAKLPPKSFLGAAIGTMVEYYDYALFTMFLPILAPLFFPGHSAYEALVKGFNVFLIAMVARPLGAMFFGYLGDVFGRRRALLSSMYGIAIATMVIGLTPSYGAIGFWSILIIAIAKTIQTFCFGGEYSGAGIYVVEHAEDREESFIGSLLTAMTLFGSLIASVIGVLITFPYMPSWSWRFAFLLGGFVGILGITYRKNFTEAPHFKPADVHTESFKDLLRQFPLELVVGIFIGGFATVPFTTVLAFIVPVFMTKGYITSQHFMIIQFFLILIAILTVIVAGRVADSKSPIRIMQIGGISLVLLSYPLLLWVDKGNLLGLLVTSTVLVIINEILLGPSNAFLKNLFPIQFRYRGSSLGFTLGMSVLGGLTPIVENYLYRSTGNFSGIALWLIFIGFGTSLSIFLASRSHKRRRVMIGYKI